MKNSNDNIGNRTRDLPACSAVSQPAAPPRASHRMYIISITDDRGLKIFQKYSNNPTITRLRKMIYSKFHTVYPHILLATIQIYSIWRRGDWNFVNPWSKSFNEYNRNFYDSLRSINSLCAESRYFVLKLKQVVIMEHNKPASRNTK